MAEQVVVKKSSIHGKGVLALKDFRKDEYILHITGSVIKTDDPSFLSEDVQNHCFPFDKKDDVVCYVLPKSPWKYLNHSCDPNAGIKNNRNIVAMKRIKKGEEITFDYAMNNVDDWTMECNCGSKKCRKIISNYSKLDDKTKEKYRNYTVDSLKIYLASPHVKWELNC